METGMKKFFRPFKQKLNIVSNRFDLWKKSTSKGKNSNFWSGRKCTFLPKVLDKNSQKRIFVKTVYHHRTSVVKTLRKILLKIYVVTKVQKC